MTASSLLSWLLDSDPALRWQVERDLMHEPEHVWGATRERVVTEGFGARLLAAQDLDGQWAGGAYFPSDFSEDLFHQEGQPWTATTWSLNALREWGAPPSAIAGTADKLAANSRWEYDDLPYWGGEVDACINGYTLANGAWLGAEVTGIAEWFVTHQLPDGGWNCEWVEGSTRSSFHSTLNSLFGILDWELITGGTDEIRAARRTAEEYLLERELFRKRGTGETVGDWVTEFRFPFRWSYSVLRAAGYFRAACLADESAPDPRMGQAIEMIRAAEQPDGTWLQAGRHPGRVWFEVDVPAGEPSKWLTFHARRVLDWWDGVHGEDRTPPED
ncbi:squalene cyclase [Ruania alkalisoli]|uniref:Squalene cyclase n=1 Tax=Ruania alkalisoli TaxID=2779775 RepID=A0A7M1SY93_9MICO|nr:squalene cyclase [Ruania alkalisoli]QOR71954.1 squalene cyclase [Ruania alkalisoli]